MKFILSYATAFSGDKKNLQHFQQLSSGEEKSMVNFATSVSFLSESSSNANSNMDPEQYLLQNLLEIILQLSSKTFTKHCTPQGSRAR